MRSYAPAIANGTVLLVRYEDMIQDLQGSVERLITFLELDDELLGNGMEDVQELLPSFTFESMKKDLDRFQPKSVTWKNNFQFLRKGMVGENKVDLGIEERQAFQEHLEETRFFQDLREEFGSDLEAINAVLKYN